MIETLRPFIVAVWNGRTNEEMPPDVREVYEAAQSTPRQTNILLCVLDERGKLIRAFPPFPGPHPGSLGFDQERMGQYLKDQIDRSTAGMKLPAVQARKTLTLPDIEGVGQPAGVRIMASFAANRLNHYRVPVVEVVPLKESERQALAHPAGPVNLSADSLRRWLEQMYPPAVMDGRGGFKRIAGTLRLRPAGADAESRYAVLQGRVEFALDNRSATLYEGDLEIVLSYSPTSGELVSLRGVLEADFPRQDLHGRTVETVRMTAAIESRPK